MSSSLRMQDNYELLNENDVLIIVCANATQLVKHLGLVVTGLTATATWKAEQYLGLDMTGAALQVIVTQTLTGGQVSVEEPLPIGIKVPFPFNAVTSNLVTRFIVESGQVGVQINSPASSLSTDNPVEFRTYIEQPASPTRIDPDN